MKENIKSLEDLGYNSFFKSKINEIDSTGFSPARVIA